MADNLESLSLDEDSLNAMVDYFKLLAEIEAQQGD